MWRELLARRYHVKDLAMPYIRRGPGSDVRRGVDYAGDDENTRGRAIQCSSRQSPHRVPVLAL